jgi:UDP-glucose 4-epimerase
MAMGFDPHLQVIHEQDAAAAVARALESDVSGAVNVAADGIVPLLLLLRRMRKRYVPVFHPLLGVAHGAASLPFDPSYLMFHCCGDTRRMRAELGFVPSRTAEQVLEELARRRGRRGRR